MIGALVWNGATASAATDYIGYWKFDGNLVDSSPNANNGATSYGTSMTAPGPKPVPGVDGSAVSFDGNFNGNYVWLARASLNGLPAWTWEGWVNPMGPGYLYTEGPGIDNPSPAMSLYLYWSGDGSLSVGAANENYSGGLAASLIISATTTPGAVPLGRWSLVTVTLEGGSEGVGTIKVYDDRALVLQAPLQEELVTFTNSVYPGGFAGFGINEFDPSVHVPYVGQLDEVQLFAYAKPPSVIACDSLADGATCGGDACNPLVCDAGTCVTGTPITGGDCASSEGSNSGSDMGSGSGSGADGVCQAATTGTTCELSGCASAVCNSGSCLCAASAPAAGCNVGRSPETSLWWIVGCLALLMMRRRAGGAKTT